MAESENLCLQNEARSETISGQASVVHRAGRSQGFRTTPIRADTTEEASKENSDLATPETFLELSQFVFRDGEFRDAISRADRDFSNHENSGNVQISHASEMYEDFSSKLNRLVG